MRRTELFFAILTAALLMSMSACAPISKPAAAATTAPIASVSTAPAPSPNPAPPPAPLSMPQTQVELPAPQPEPPLSAYDLAPLPDPVPTPAPAVKPRAPRTNPPPPTTAHTETVGPVVVATPAETERAPITEILPPGEQKQLVEQVAGKLTEAHRILDSIKSRHRTPQQSANFSRAVNYLRQSEDAQKHGNIRQAEAYADLALVFANELNNAK